MKNSQENLKALLEYLEGKTGGVGAFQYLKESVKSAIDRSDSDKKISLKENKYARYDGGDYWIDVQLSDFTEYSDFNSVNSVKTLFADRFEHPYDYVYITIGYTGCVAAISDNRGVITASFTTMYGRGRKYVVKNCEVIEKVFITEDSVAITYDGDPEADSYWVGPGGEPKNLHDVYASNRDRGCVRVKLYSRSDGTIELDENEFQFLEGIKDFSFEKIHEKKGVVR